MSSDLGERDEITRATFDHAERQHEEWRRATIQRWLEEAESQSGRFSDITDQLPVLDTDRVVPVPDTYRVVLVPDTDRVVLTTGAKNLTKNEKNVWLASTSYLMIAGLIAVVCLYLLSDWIDFPPNECTLCKLSEQRDHEYMEWVLKEGLVDPNNTCRSKTPLLCAVNALDPEGVKLLLKYGADINKVSISTGNEWSPLHMAVTLAKRKYYDYTFVKFLIDQGAHVNLSVDWGPSGFNHPTPLLLAIIGGDLELVRLLVDHGANGDDIAIVFNGNAYNLLDVAIMKGYKEIEEYLRANGATSASKLPMQVDPEIVRVRILPPHVSAHTTPATPDQPPSIAI